MRVIPECGVHVAVLLFYYWTVNAAFEADDTNLDNDYNSAMQS